MRNILNCTTVFHKPLHMRQNNSFAKRSLLFTLWTVEIVSKTLQHTTADRFTRPP
jgi:hypothetical protein